MFVVIVGSPSDIDLTFGNIREFTMRKSSMSALSVGNAFTTDLPSFNIREFTLVKSLMSVISVGNFSEERANSLITSDVTLVKGLLSVVNVGNLFVVNITSRDMGEFTPEKCLLVNLGNPLIVRGVLLNVVKFIL